MCVARIDPPFCPPDCRWILVTPGSTVPENAYQAGGKLHGSLVHIGRVFDDGDYLIGTALPDKGTCLYLNRKHEVMSTDTYEILTVVFGEPLQFQLSLDSAFLFSSGGNEYVTLYTARVVDGENNYIGWADQELRKVYIPRESSAGPSVLEDEDYYEVMIHRYLDRL